MPREWAGTALNTREPFPLLLKFLFPEQWLSVQVHPDDAYARMHEAASGGMGKTEMWHVISAKPDASVLVGLKPEVAAEKFRQKISDGSVEECIERIPIFAGDTIFVPAGTVHTIGPGMVLCEIQENSDLTYRVFDYNRKGSDGKPRALHVEQALAVTRFGKQIGGKLPRVQRERSGRTVTLCAACRHFATEKWELLGRANRATMMDRFEMYVFLEGAGRIETPSAPPQNYAAGEAWFMPASLGAFQLTPTVPTTLLRVFVPDMDAVKKSFSGTPAAQVIFP